MKKGLAASMKCVALSGCGTGGLLRAGIQQSWRRFLFKLSSGWPVFWVLPEGGELRAIPLQPDVSAAGGLLYRRRRGAGSWSARCSSVWCASPSPFNLPR